MNKQDIAAARDLMNDLASARLNSVLEARILFTIAAADKPMAVGELAEALDTPLSTISRVVWGLSEDKLVGYEDDPKDRRRKTLTANLKRLNGVAPTKATPTKVAAKR